MKKLKVFKYSILVFGGAISFLGQTSVWAQDSTTPAFEGKIQLTMINRSINQSARFNSNNEILLLNSEQQTVEINLGLSDYLDADEAWRCMFKAYGYRLYEKDRDLTEDDDQLRIDELFLDWSFGNWFASVGKRRNSWGPALAFNPVNVIVPPRNPFRPDQQTEGHPLFWLNYSDDFLSIDLLATRNYDRNWYGRYQRWGARLGLVLDETDIGFYYYDGEPYEDDSEYNRMVGFSYSGNFLNNSTLYAEIASFSQNDRNYYTKAGAVETRDESVVKAAVGSNITLDNNASLLFEVYHNTGGYTEEERKNYLLAVDSVLNPFPDVTRFGVFDDFQFSEMNRNYLLISFRKTSILDKYDITLQTLIAEDASTASEIEGGYNISDYYKINALVKHYTGDEDSEFGNNQVTSELQISLNGSY